MTTPTVPSQDVHEGSAGSGAPDAAGGGSGSGSAEEVMEMNANPWREVIDEALISDCLDCIRPDETPEQALSRLIRWEVTIALDPAVSSRAAALQSAAQEEARRLREALALIAQTDPVDAILDPQRAIRVASAALSQSQEQT